MATNLLHLIFMVFIVCLVMCWKMKNMFFKFAAVCVCVDTAGICYCFNISIVIKKNTRN